MSPTARRLRISPRSSSFSGPRPHAAGPVPTGCCPSGCVGRPGIFQGSFAPAHSLWPRPNCFWAARTFVRRADAYAEVAALKKSPGREIPDIWQPRSLERPARRRLDRRAAFHDWRWRGR